MLLFMPIGIILLLIQVPLKLFIDDSGTDESSSNSWFHDS